MADHIATTSIHSNVTSLDMSEAEVRPWIEKQLAFDRANPLGLLHDPLEPEAFAAMQKRFTAATNGVRSDYRDFHEHSLGARFPARADVTARYGRGYAGELPFDDAIVDPWGGPCLAFASNADFRGNQAHVGGPRVLDAVRCTGINILPDGARHPSRARLTYPQIHANMERWSTEAGSGDVWFDVTTRIMHGLRGARIAVLPAGDWIAADEWSDHQITDLLQRDGRPAHSFDSVPPMNGARPLDSRNGEFFIVVRTAEQRLAVAELTSCEFGSVGLWCRPRPARSPK